MKRVMAMMTFAALCLVCILLGKTEGAIIFGILTVIAWEYI